MPDARAHAMLVPTLRVGTPVRTLCVPARCKPISPASDQAPRGTQSVQTAPHFYSQIEIDMQRAQTTIADLRARSIELTDAFIAGVEAECPTLALATPRDSARRGSQISFRHPEGYAIMQALIARGVIGDFRAPDILRFGFTPLYTRRKDVEGAVAILAEIMRTDAWNREEYRRRARVT